MSNELARVKIERGRGDCDWYSMSGWRMPIENLVVTVSVVELEPAGAPGRNEPATIVNERIEKSRLLTETRV